MGLSKAHIHRIFAEHHEHVVKAVAVLRPDVKGVTAEDVEQEVSIRLLKLIESDREIENISSYIYKITANVIIDLARKNQRHTNETSMPEEADEDNYKPDLKSEELGPENILANEKLMKLIMQAIETLPESRRIAVKLRLQGFSVKEMCEMTGWSFYKAENLSKRAMAALKDKLVSLGIDYEIN
ncbi:MAG: sigma-70 family RNA polymerase sigma factor [Xanthomonadales bacterium]|nr:sigma-70 family RNA polymerase sigma factor [Xanthomonadales bacterium]